MSAAVVRHFVAVKDGVVVGSRSTLRTYRFAVLHQGADGWFATFHGDLEGARVGLQMMQGHFEPNEIIGTIETPERLAVGSPAPSVPPSQGFEQLVAVVH